MAWLESHQQLERHPKTMRLMYAMGWDIDTTIGKLHRFWWWVLDFAPNGDLSKYSPELIGQSIGLSADISRTFMDKLADIKFVDRGEGVLRVHNWLRYAGRYLRDTKFKRNDILWKEAQELYAIPCNPTTSPVSRHIADMQPTSCSESAVPNQPTNPTRPTLPDQTPPTPSPKARTVTYSPEFSAFWETYPNKKGKDKAWVAWKKRIPDIPQNVCEIVERHKSSEDFKKENGRFVPHPATWLNQGRWADVLTEKEPGKWGWTLDK